MKTSFVMGAILLVASASAQYQAITLSGSGTAIDGGPDSRIFGVSGRPVTWEDTSSSASSLPNTFSLGYITRARGGVVTGYAFNNDSIQRAETWDASTLAQTKLHNSSWYASWAYGTDGLSVAGYYRPTSQGNLKPLVWDAGRNVTYLPFTGSESYATTVSGDVVYGRDGYYASKWKKSGSTYVESHLGGFFSTVWDSAGTQAVGSDSGQAELWDTDGSHVALTTTGGEALAVNGGYQAGYFYGPANVKAGLWHSSLGSLVDLSQFLPAGTVSSYAYGVDSSGNAYGTYSDSSYNSHPVVWKLNATPEPASLLILGGSILGYLKRRRKAN